MPMTENVRNQMTDSERWQTVLARQASADGQFVYAVRSTGIYCRPSCPSRRPTRSRVEFFDAPADAERAGYRACRRCHPRDHATDPWVEKVRRACVYLANVEGQPSLTKLARRLGGSPYHLHRNFKRLLGVTPREFADASRMNKVKRGLKRGRDVTTAVLEAGYGSNSRFYDGALEKLGMTPSRYKKGGAGMNIRYAVFDSPLGKLLVAATDRGICAVSMGTSASDLQAGLAKEFPAASLTSDPRTLGPWAEDLVRQMSRPVPRLELPLDLRATAFQRQVWQALTNIPPGETRSYGEIAAAIGQPRAARAVARACATNPVALAIPCHRVVPATGGSGGYRWGTARKQALLARERPVPRI
jgi:AraC family transcriptional regulator of adaptative response/methylated-DNA-[protein]-cysteine methyltransferase